MKKQNQKIKKAASKNTASKGKEKTKLGSKLKTRRSKRMWSALER